jgi:hypothetical protein
MYHSNKLFCVRSILLQHAFYGPEKHCRWQQRSPRSISNTNRKVFLKTALLVRWSPQPLLSKKQRKPLELFRQENTEEVLEIPSQSNFVSNKSHTEGNGKQFFVHCIPPRKKQTPLYRPRDRRLSAKLVPTLADRGWSAQRIPMAVNFGFLDRSRYFLEISPQLSSRG